MAYLNQYRDILAKAKTIKEILDVKERMRRLEEEIDSKKGRIRYLDDQVNFSTLNLTLTQLIERDLAGLPSFGSKIIDSFKKGFDGLLGFILIIVSFWPFLLFFLFIWVIRKRLLTIGIKKI